MTYKLNPGLRLVTSPVTLVFPNGRRESYDSGASVADSSFDERCLVEEVRATGDIVEVYLVQVGTANPQWTSEDVSFF